MDGTVKQQDNHNTTTHATLRKKLLTEKEAAGYLGLENHQTLAVWRSNKRYPIPYVKVGRSVRYRESDLLEWLESRTCQCA